MNIQKNKQEHHHKVGKRIFNTLTKILAVANIEFATNYNALYGMPHLVAILAKMCRLGVTAEEAVNTIKIRGGMNVPSAKWFRNMVNSVSDDNVHKMCDKMLSDMNKIARRAGLDRGKTIIVAIDKHLIPRLDKSIMKYLVGSKAKGGTTKFEGYITMQAVDSPIDLILGMARIIKGDKNTDFVRKFMQKLKKMGLRASMVLLDREFYSVDVMTVLHETNNKFLMPAVKNKGIKKAVKQYCDGTRKQVSEYTAKNKKGTKFTFTLIIRESETDDKDESSDEKERKYVTFATNVSPSSAAADLDGLIESYGKRWGIETGYKQLEMLRPWTCSRNPAFRMFLIIVAVFLLNMVGHGAR